MSARTDRGLTYPLFQPGDAPERFSIVVHAFLVETGARRAGRPFSGASLKSACYRAESTYNTSPAAGEARVAPTSQRATRERGGGLFTFSELQRELGDMKARLTLGLEAGLGLLIGACWGLAHACGGDSRVFVAQDAFR
jgi:hypothetical protein